MQQHAERQSESLVIMTALTNIRNKSAKTIAEQCNRDVRICHLHKDSAQGFASMPEISCIPLIDVNPKATVLLIV